MYLKHMLIGTVSEDRCNRIDTFKQEPCVQPCKTAIERTILPLCSPIERFPSALSLSYQWSISTLTIYVFNDSFLPPLYYVCFIIMQIFYKS